MIPKKFKFFLSKEKFGYDNIGDTIYTATLISDNAYLVEWKDENGLDSVEYSKVQVEDNVKEGFWVIKE